MNPQRLQASYRREGAAGRVHVFDASGMPWQDTANPGLKLKPVRNDAGRGDSSAGELAPFVRSALHQHQGWPRVCDRRGSRYHGC
jgi:hypothetical protein